MKKKGFIRRAVAILTAFIMVLVSVLPVFAAEQGAFLENNSIEEPESGDSLTEEMSKEEGVMEEDGAEEDAEQDSEEDLPEQVEQDGEITDDATENLDIQSVTSESEPVIVTAPAQENGISPEDNTNPSPEDPAENGQGEDLGLAVAEPSMEKINEEWYCIGDELDLEIGTVLIVEVADRKYIVEIMEPGIGKVLTGFQNVEGVTYYATDSSDEEAGFIHEKANALIKAEDGKYYYVFEGMVKKYTGLVPKSDDTGWFFAKDGVYDDSFTGFAISSKNNDYYFARNGKYDNSFTGLALSAHAKGYYFARKGKYDKSFTGLALSAHADGYYFARNGKYDNSFTGLALSAHAKGYYYAKKGKYDKSFTGIAKSAHANGYYYAKKGKYDTSFTGLAKGQDKNKKYYVKKGKWDKNYTGLVKDKAMKGTFYVKKGVWSLEKDYSTGKKKIGNDYYVFETANGKMITGWCTFGDPSKGNCKAFYCDSKGRLARGNKKINGYTYKFDSKTGEFKSRTFPTGSSVGISYGSSADKTLDNALNKMILFWASQGVIFEDAPMLDKANMIIIYIGAHYYYADGAYDALGMLSKGYGTCFAYSDLTYCFARKCGINKSWRTKPGRNVDHSVKMGNATGYRMYGSQHRTVVAQIGGKYYDLDANGAFIDLAYGGGQYVLGAEKISSSYANYLLGNTNSYSTIH